MRRRLFAIWAGVILYWTLLAGAQAQVTARPDRPVLVLLVAIDQFRYDYLTRFRAEYTGGLKLLLDRGAVFVNANLEHYPTVTAIGHSTMLSGATPATSGIIGNDWYDRESGKRVTSVSDDATKLLGGGGGRGSSPRRLLVSTVGDELKRSSRSSKVIGMSLKDRSAILPAGHMADGAYWYNEATGDFVSSTYYFPELPVWAREFNAEKHADIFKGKTWLDRAAGHDQRQIPAEIGPKFYAAVYSSPYGNDLLEAFAERAMEVEQLGRRGVTDLLTVSFSSNDAIGHAYGPDSPEAHAVSLGVDRSLANLLSFVDRTVGLNHVLVMLTADHGVAPSPTVLADEHLPGGRMKGKLADPAQQALEARYGPGNWVLDTTGASLYLNSALIADRRLDPGEVQKTAARAIAALPEVARVYTREQMLAGRYPVDRFESRVLRGFNPSRSGDVEVILHPYWIRDTSTATHGTPYNYDAHIPLVFMGAGIHPGAYYKAAALNDLAPTVSALLEVEIPSGSVGRILDEMLK